MNVNLYVQSATAYSTVLSSALEFGRQRQHEPPPYTRIDDRVIIARLQESEISRQHVRLELLPGGQVRVTNLSRLNRLLLGTSDELQPGEHREVRPPSVVALGGARVIQFEAAGEQAAQGEALESFSHHTIAPGSGRHSVSSIADMLGIRRDEDQTEFLLRGLHATIEVFQPATNSAEFFALAAQAMVDVVGLETAAALLWRDQNWHIEARVSRDGGRHEQASEWAPSRTILQHVRQEKKTFWRVPDNSQAASLVDVKALVAAPILNRDGEVVGALYGDRRHRKGGRSEVQITEVEAILVELLSSGVASGLARIEQEKAAVAARVLFDQFFTPELSRQLEAEPDLLLGKDVEVTLLDCDIRGFTDVSEQLGARLTLDWIHDVMGTLSRCVADHHGVLVDTLGDELIGMWGAPVDRSDHAELACRAAIAMLDALPALNRRWQGALEQPLDLGIGIHTARARVGNIGSDTKFKYGPLGSIVLVTELTESETGPLMVKILITGATAAKLDEGFSTRRIGRLEHAPDAAEIELFELAVDVPPDWAEVKRRYEAALEAFQRSDLPTATRLLGKILADHPSDRASLQLLARVNQRLSGPAGA